MALQGKRTYQFMVDGKNDNPYKKTTLQYFEVRKMSYGMKRRALLMKLFKAGVEFYVNCNHCIQLKDDKDLQKLIKQGKIEMVNEVITRYNTFSIKHSFVRLKKT